MLSSFSSQWQIAWHSNPKERFICLTVSNASIYSHKTPLLWVHSKTESIRAAFAGSNATAPFMAARKQRENENEVSDRYGLQRHGPTKPFIPVVSCLLKIWLLHHNTFNCRSIDELMDCLSHRSHDVIIAAFPNWAESLSCMNMSESHFLSKL